MVPCSRGIEGNEIADGWAKIAAVEELDSHGVEWLRHSDKYGRQPTPLPASPAHLKRRISDKKWKEAHEWSRPNQEPQTRHQAPQA